MTTQKLTHGGDWAGFETEYGRKPLDFSMNVNPLGVPREVRAAIARAGLYADRYPDPLCRKLVGEIAVYEDVPREWIVCGGGAADLIFRLAKAMRPEVFGRRPRLLVTAPTFSEYEAAFGEYGWDVRHFELREERGFHVGDEILSEIDGELDAVFLCEPNNPTGVTTDPELLNAVIRRCGRTGTRIVVDECFNGFLDDPDAHSVKRHLSADAKHLIILKAFTKIFGMAGVRLGYCLCADPDIREGIRRAGPPWNVSSLAQAAGIAALTAEEHIRQGRQIVRDGRWELRESLRSLGLEPVYGEANYLLFRGIPGLAEAMRRRGILIRDCGNYRGLGEGWYRIAVRGPEENGKLVRALSNALAGQKQEKLR